MMNWASYLPEILDRLDIGLLACDGGRLAAVNDAFCRLVGRPRDDLVGQEATNLVVPEEREVLADRSRRRLAGQPVPRDYVTTFVHEDGRRVDCEVAAVVLEIEDRQRVVALVRDISTRVELERATLAERNHERAARDELRRLSRRLVDLQEAERRRIAREVHDAIGQELIGLKLLLERLERTATAADRPVLAEARTGVVELMDALEALSLELRPTVLDDLGLAAALEWLVERLAARSGLRIELAVAGLDRRIDDRVETAAFRITQEALSNVLHHARATRALVRCALATEHLDLSVEDDGAGFDPAATAAGGIGLLSMRERAQALAGSLDLDAAPGRGTRLVARLPLRPDPAAVLEI